MIMRDMKNVSDTVWPSTKRRIEARVRAERRNRVISQVVGVTVGLNSVVLALYLLIPAGMWLALGLLIFGSAFTALIVKDILDEA